MGPPRDEGELGPCRNFLGRNGRRDEVDVGGAGAGAGAGVVVRAVRAVDVEVGMGGMYRPRARAVVAVVDKDLAVVRKFLAPTNVLAQLMAVVQEACVVVRVDACAVRGEGGSGLSR